LSQPRSFRRALKRGILRGAAAAALLAGIATTGGTAAHATSSTDCSIVPLSGVSLTGTPETVILSGPNASLAASCVDATILDTYPATGALAVSVADSVVGALQSTSGVVVTPDLTVSVQSTVAVSTGPHTPSDVFLKETGADKVAQQGDTGQGVTVAVLDTGIDGNLPDFAGRLVGGVDLTGEGNPFQDDYGHGTFVAGLIAGNGASSGGEYSGEAPGANLVSIKVAGATGSTDLATVMAGVQWAITNEQTYGIRVLNMSLGFQPITSTFLNPLDQIVEAAWNDGIAVITSAGNAGPFNGTILSPGDDPLAITVGALDDMATASINDDEMTNFSSVGPTNPDGWVKPDLVASGRSVVSLADPGSTIYNDYPTARIGSANFVGSGTSFSTAITSGAAALVIEAHPGITPDQLKAMLLGTTNPGPIGNPFVDGHGALDALAAVDSTVLGYNQSLSGLSAVPMGATVSLANSGPADTWNPALWTGVTWTGAAWAGSAWDGAAWAGSAWNGVAWDGAAWASSTWTGAAWAGAAWAGSAWDGAAWAGSAWDGAAWAGAAWAGSAWA